MKWAFGAVLAILGLVSCNNELVVTDNWKDIPVVWGILSTSDTAHYIRVEKAFLDPNTSALDIARIPDSLYYENAQVSLKRIASGVEIPLTRVDGNLDGYPRKDGIFAETPNYIYKIKSNVANLVEGERYELRIIRDEHSAPVVAETYILPRPEFRELSPGTPLPFRPNSAYTFRWREVPNARLYELQITFHYEEQATADSLFVPKSIHWTIKSPIRGTDYEMQGYEFFNNLAALIPYKPQAVRRFNQIDLTLWCGGSELDEFNRILLANTGLTATQDIPVYSNLSEGYGIFSSRNVTVNTGYGLTNLALDSLKNSVLTKSLNFK